MSLFSPSELFRLHTMTQVESRLSNQGFCRVAGVDEAGRGPLAGPVVAAACILLNGVLFQNLNDSKKLSPKIRDVLFGEITTSSNVIYAIGVIDVEVIDQVNILQATLLAMQMAVKNLKEKADYLLIDGNKAPHFDVPSMTIIKGDSYSLSIAAASILAKVTRDRIMSELDEKWPMYGFKKHKGYGTAEHLKAIDQYGPSLHHRLSFAPIRNSLMAKKGDNP